LGIANARFFLHAAILPVAQPKVSKHHVDQIKQAKYLPRGGEVVEVTPNDFHKIRWKVGTLATGEDKRPLDFGGNPEITLR